MSTKTTFKRIALVTVAALGFGVMSVAPSNAAADSMTLGATTSSATVGVAVTNTVTLSAISAAAGGEVLNATVVLLSAPSTSGAAGVLPSSTVGASAGTNADSATITGGFSVTSKAIGRFTATGVVSVTPDVAGTYVYRITPGGANALNTTAQTWTVTATAQSVASVTNFISNLSGFTSVAATSDTGTLVAASAVAPGAVARLTSTQYRSTDTTSPIANTSALGVTVTISGAGALGTADAAPRGPSVSFSAGTSATNSVWVFADGRSGTATITTTIGTFTSTKTFKFLGTMVSFVTTDSKKNVGVGEAMTITAAGADVNGNETAAPTLTSATVSSDATVATVAVAGNVATVTGVKAGTATITLSDGTVTKNVAVTVLPTTAPTLSWAFDQDSYNSGDKMTVTIKATGIADGARSVFDAAPASNFNLTTLSTSAGNLVANPVFTSGVATFTLYAPATPGKLTLSATVGSAIDSEAKIIAAAGTRTAVSLSTTVTNAALTAAQEATDAANEATDAGNNAKDAADQAIEAADAATIAAQDAAAAAEAAGAMAVEAAEAAGAIAQDALDAANAATDAALSAAEAADAATAAATEAKESADAATAAVAELSTKVAALMAALNAKVTTLSNLVAKIAKKVKA